MWIGCCGNKQNTACLSISVNTSKKGFALVVKKDIFQRSSEWWYAKHNRNYLGNGQRLKCQQVELYQFSTRWRIARFHFKCLLFITHKQLLYKPGLKLCTASRKKTVFYQCNLKLTDIKFIQKI